MPRLSVDTAHHNIKDDELERTSPTSSNAPSAISILPSDVLSLIFQYTYDPIPPFDGSYRCSDTSNLLRTLSLVSKHWYKTLMETPELWESINMSMEGADASKYATGLASFFEKTRYRSLSLSLDFSGLVKIDDDLLLHPSVDTVISKNLERIENLQLVKPPRAWFSQIHHLSRMEHLSLFQVQGNPVHLSLDCTPSLSKFTLINGNIRLLTPCPITSLTLISVPLGTCFNLVAHCPKLTNLHLEYYHTTGRHNLNDTMPIEASLPPRLEVLVWKVFGPCSFFAPWQIALLNHLNVHSLHTLTWYQPPAWTLQDWYSWGQALRTAINDFFTRLSEKLTCIAFVESHDSTQRSETWFIDCLRNDQAIQKLRFSECNTGFLMSLFEKLASRFPRLNMMAIGKIVWSNPRDVDLDERFEKMLGERFLEMVKGRMRAMEGRLAVCFEDDSSYREEDGSNCAWLRYIKQEVVELKGCGYQIEIFIASKPVNWLQVD